MGTTAEKLNKLKATKTAIKQAIIDKGVAVADSDTFATYPDKIGAIQSGVIPPLPEGDKKWITGVFPQGSVIDLTKGGFSGLSLRYGCFSNLRGVTEIIFSNYMIYNVCERMYDLKKASGTYLEGFSEHAFSQCYELEELNFPNTPGDYAQYLADDCTKLRKVVISPKTEQYALSCFANCTNLDISTLPFNNVKSLGFNSFGLSNKESDTIQPYELNLPNLENASGWGAFARRIKLKKITIGNKLTELNDYTFSECTGLETIVINKPQDSVAGAPWGAPNATVVWNG